MFKKYFLFGTVLLKKQFNMFRTQNKILELFFYFIYKLFIYMIYVFN